jgi:hypothetical protein
MTDLDRISFLCYMNALVPHALSVVAAFNQTRKARRRRQLIWIGIFEFINVWRKPRREASTEAGM